MKKEKQKPTKKRKKRAIVSENEVLFDLDKRKYFRIICGKEYECFPSGYLRDFEDSEIVISHGRLLRKPSPDACRKMNLAIEKKMIECFPNSFARMGEIEYVEVKSSKGRSI